MSVVLVRVDDRLIHGQVVVGWVHALNADRIALVDDKIYQSDWERELYRLGVPSNVELLFESVESAARTIQDWKSSKHRTIVLLGDVLTLASLCKHSTEITEVNVGAIHQRDGTTERLPYVFLSETEGRVLRDLADRGVKITAQDVPTAHRVALRDFV